MEEQIELDINDSNDDIDADEREEIIGADLREMRIYQVATRTNS